MAFRQRSSGGDSPNYDALNALAGSEENTAKGGTDPVTKVLKDKVKKDGTTIKKIKTKDPITGKVTISYKKTDPGTAFAELQAAIIGSATSGDSKPIPATPPTISPGTTTEVNTVDPLPSNSETNTPPEETIKITETPIKKPPSKWKGWEHAYSTADKDKYPNIEIFKETSIANTKKAKEKNKPKQPTFEPITRMPGKGPSKIETQPRQDLAAYVSFDSGSESGGDEWVRTRGRRKGKDKLKDKGRPRKTPPPPGLDPTGSSVACTKEGNCGPGGLHTESMFGSMSGKQTRAINKSKRQIKREGNKEGREAFRQINKDVRQRKMDSFKKSFTKNTSYKQHKSSVPLKYKIRDMFRS